MLIYPYNFERCLENSSCLFLFFLFLPACGIRKRSKESEKFEREFFFFFKSNFHLRVKSNVISLI